MCVSPCSRLQSQRLVSNVTLIMFVVFFSRSIWNFVTAAGAATVIINSTNVTANLEALAIYCAWEIFPVVLLLVTVAAGAPVMGGAAYPKRQFGVVGAGVVVTPTTTHTDAQSSLNSYDVYIESPPNASGDGSAIVGPDASGSGVDSQIGHSSRSWRHYRRKSNPRGAAVMSGEGEGAHDDVASVLQPLLRGGEAESESAMVLEVVESRPPSAITAPPPLTAPAPLAAPVPVALSPQVGSKRVSGRGLAHGAKSKVVNLGGDDPGYGGDPYVTYGEYGSYGNTHVDAGGSPGMAPKASRRKPAPLQHPQRYDTPPSE